MDIPLKNSGAYLATRFLISFSIMNPDQAYSHVKEIAPECGYILPTLGWSSSAKVIFQCASVGVLENDVVGLILYVASVEADKVRQRLLVSTLIKLPERRRFAFIVLFGIRGCGCVGFEDENITRRRTCLSKFQ